MQNSKLNKIKTVFAVLLLIFTVFSSFTSVLEAGHNCSGEDCPICRIIGIAESNLKLLELFGLAFEAVSLFSAISVKKYSKSVVLNKFNLETLITRKIRLND